MAVASAKCWWAPGTRSKVRAEIAKQEIEKLLAKSKGKLKTIDPDELWMSQADPSAPLHDCFTWDDRECGVLWRRREAQNIIRAVEVEYELVGRAPAYLGIHVVGGRGNNCRRNYGSTPQVVKARGVDLYTEAKATLKSARRRFSMVEQLTKVWAAIDGIE